LTRHKGQRRGGRINGRSGPAAVTAPTLQKLVARQRDILTHAIVVEQDCSFAVEVYEADEMAGKEGDARAATRAAGPFEERRISGSGIGVSNAIRFELCVQARCALAPAVGATK